jgi:hypothetical protein
MAELSLLVRAKLIKEEILDDVVVCNLKQIILINENKKGEKIIVQG